MLERAPGARVAILEAAVCGADLPIGLLWRAAVNWYIRASVSRLLDLRLLLLLPR